MRVLVIGGTGLMSTPLVRKLAERGFDVIMFNRGQTKRRGIPDGVQHIVGNRTDYAMFEQAMRMHEVDAVIDMLCFTPSDAQSCLRAFRGRVQQFIFCSTVRVQGGPLDRLPALEDDACHPVAEDARNKLACEQLFRAAYARDGFPVTIFRPASTFGPGRAPLGIFMWDKYLPDRIRRGKPILVHGDGLTLWQDLYVDNCADGFVEALGNERAIGQVYNIGGEAQTWNDHFRRMADALGGTANLVHVPTDLLLDVLPDALTGGLRTNFQYHVFHSCQKLMRDVPGFGIHISYEEGIRRTVAWMEEEGLSANSDEDTLPERFAQEMGAARERLQQRLGDWVTG